MTHKEFVGQYKAGKLQIRVDRSSAFQAVSEGYLPKRYYYANLFWSWIWLLLIPIGIFLIFKVNLFLGIGAIVISFLLPAALKDSTAGFVKDHALEDEEFYNAAVKSGLLIIEER